MASDEDYMAFLDKANRDPNEGYAKPQSSSNGSSGAPFKATDDGAQIPAAIQEATREAFYVSDADEPFVPVCLAWDETGKGLPDEGTLGVYFYFEFSFQLLFPIRLTFSYTYHIYHIHHTYLFVSIAYLRLSSAMAYEKEWIRLTTIALAQRSSQR